MFILLLVVPAIIFIIFLIINKDLSALLFSIAAFLLMLLATGVCASSISDEDIRIVSVVSDTELVELDDNIYVVEAWDEKDDVKYQYLCQNAQFKEKTYKDKDKIKIIYEKGVKPHSVEYKCEWTNNFAKFVFCSPPQNKTVIYLPSTSNLCVSWPN